MRCALAQAFKLKGVFPQFLKGMLANKAKHAVVLYCILRKNGEIKVIFKDVLL